MLDNWKESAFSDNDLVLVDGYKVRLITLNELLNNLGYNSNEVVTEKVYKLTSEVPDWVYKYYQYGEYSYWTMSSIDDSNNAVSVVLKSGDVSSLASYFTINWQDEEEKENMVYKYHPVRPVINLNKCIFEDGCYEEEINVLDGCINDNNICIDDSTGLFDKMENPETIDNITKYFLLALISILSLFIVIFRRESD